MAKKLKKNKSVTLRPLRPLSEKAGLALFLGSWERSKNWIPIEPTEQNSIDCILNKCRNRLNEIETEARKIEAEIEALENNYKAKYREKIEVLHKITRFTGRMKKLPGSAFKPK